MMKKIDTSYVSPLDKFLAELDKNTKKSVSQKKEIEKYARIARLRDHATQEEVAERALWEEM
ncbi:MAG: hypothetical protein HY939_02175 [Gammaproteobacteria bacterium]|nr:hypothetical protein [Gammaproteobacteria bacterium]